MTLPSHLVKYLAKIFGCWHIGIEILSATIDHMKDDNITIRDYVFDSLAEIYAEFAEEDMFCGLWRRRSVLGETEKLQHWDILYEFGENKGHQELMLVSAWRTRDWSVEKDSLEEQINCLPQATTPRRRAFEAFVSLLSMPAAVGGQSHCASRSSLEI